MERDMTKGSPMKLILWFTVPLLIGNVFQQLYNMVDTIIVGRYVGVQALAAVGSTGTIMFLIQGFMLGLTAGFTVLTAQRFGAGDVEGMKKTVASAYVLSIVITIVITALSMIGMRPLLELMNTPEDIIQDAYDYIIVICAGTGAVVLYNLLASIMRAVGDSKTPLYFLIISAVLNIFLDLLFIIVFYMGVKGAAYATILSQGIAGVLCLIYMLKKFPNLRIHREHWRLDKNCVRYQISLGLPMALQFSITAVGAIILQSALNVFGSIVVAAYTAANKMEQLVVQALPSLGVTVSTFCAQNLGAGHIPRIKEGIKKSVMLAFIFGFFAMATMLLAGNWLVRLFITDPTDEILHYAGIYLVANGIFEWMLGLLFVYRNALQGMGRGVVPLIAGGCELFARVVVAFVGKGIGSYMVICLASPFAWLCATIPLMFAYYRLMKDFMKRWNERLAEREQEQLLADADSC